jgi:hypothetical protein
MSSLMPKDWLDAGYKRFPTSKDPVLGRMADFGLQRKVADDRGICYFLTVYVYDWTKDPPIPGRKGWAFMPELYFTAKTFPSMDITFRADDLSIQEIEEYVRRLWIKLDCPYYEYFE